jgi:hypothetical protein
VWTIIFEFSNSDGNDIEIALMFYSDTKLEDPDMEISIKAVPITIDHTCQPVYFRPPEFMILQSVGDHYRRIGITAGCLWRKDIRAGETLVKRPIWAETEGLEIAFPVCTGDEEIIDVE